MKVPNLTDSRILIVDDQPDNLRLLGLVLEFDGYENVNCLSDSRSLLATFLEFQPDLVLLDLHMPHIDGLTALTQLSAVIPGDEYLPVLMLTGDNTSEAKEKALLLGAHDFIFKPFNRIEVHLRVKNLLQTRSLHRQVKAQDPSWNRFAERAKLVDELERVDHTLRDALIHLGKRHEAAGSRALDGSPASTVDKPLDCAIEQICVARQILEMLTSQGTEAARVHTAT